MIGRVREIWRLLNLPCDEVARLASATLDRKLTAGEGIALRSHLLYCHACRRYLAQIRRIREMFRQIAQRPDHPDDRLPDDVRDRIKKALKGG